MAHLWCVDVSSLKTSSDKSPGDEYQHCHGDPVAKEKMGFWNKFCFAQHTALHN